MAILGRFPDSSGSLCTLPPHGLAIKRGGRDVRHGLFVNHR